MNRITLAETIRRYYLQGGLTPEEADAEAEQVRSWLLMLGLGKASADIHLRDFYFVTFEEDGEFYVDSDHFEVALGSQEGIGGENS